MTAAPSPAWLALQLGELLAQRPAELSDAHRRALDYTAAVHRTAGTGLDLALRCDSFDLLGDHELREALRRQLDVCIDGKARAEDRNKQLRDELGQLKDRIAEYGARRSANLSAATPGAVSTDHPATSRAAAESVAQSAKMERLRVLASVIEDGPASASVIAARLGLVPNQVAARAWELRKGKWLEWRPVMVLAGEGPDIPVDELGYVTDVTPHGRAGNVLYLTEHGRAELVREHGTLEVAAKLLREGLTS